MTKAFFDNKNFGPGHVGVAIKTMAVGDFTRLLDSVVGGLSVADVIGVAEWKGLISPGAGEIVNEKNEELGLDLARISLWPFANERLSPEEKRKAAPAIGALGILLQRLLRDTDETDDKSALNPWQCWPGGYQRTGHIFNILFEGQRDQIVPLFVSVLSSLSLFDIFFIAHTKGLQKNVTSAKLRDIQMGIKADRIPVRDAVEIIRRRVFPDSPDIAFFVGDPKEEWYKLEKPLFHQLADELSGDVFSDYCLSGVALEKISIKTIFSAIKAMFSEISLRDLFFYSHGDFVSDFHLSEEAEDTEFLEYAISDKKLLDVCRIFPSYHPEFLKLKFALHFLGVDITDLKEPTNEGGREWGVSQRQRCHYHVLNMLKKIKFATALRMILHLGYIDFLPDGDFDDGGKEKSLHALGVKIENIGLADVVKKIADAKQLGSHRTFVEEFGAALNI